MALGSLGSPCLATLGSIQGIDMSFLKEPVLLNTWKAVLDNLEACIGFIRINEGYEDCVITVCISAGDSLDTFTVPRGEWVHGIAGALSRFTSSRGGHSARRNDASKLMETRASRGVSCKKVVVPLSVRSDERSKSNYVDIIRHMIMAEMKRFLSAVRDGLCLRAFVSPDEAKDRFNAETSYLIPGALGRSNS